MSYIQEHTGRRDEDFKRDFIENHKNGKVYNFFIEKQFYTARFKDGKIIVATTPSDMVKKIFSLCGYVVEKGDVYGED